MKNDNNVERNILLIAQALDNKVSENIIIDVYKDKKFNQKEIFYLFQAAKIIHKYRKEAGPKKSMIKRLP